MGLAYYISSFLISYITFRCLIMLRKEQTIAEILKTQLAMLMFWQ